jgi:hypothetical protein
MGPTEIKEERPDEAKLFYGWIIVIAVTLIYTIAEIPTVWS